MVSRRDLSADPVRRDAARFRRAAEAGRQLATGPHGITDLGDGDILWTGADGQHSVRDLPASITGLEDALASGLSTTSRLNTVSTLAPSSTEGYPEDAFWTQVGVVGGERVVVGTWHLAGGAWLPVGEDASRLTVGQLDVGLIDVAMVWAEMIEAGSAVIMGPSGVRLLLDSAGLHYYDENGAEVVTLGTVGQNLISVGSATIDDQGGVTGRTGTFETLRVGGRDLGELIDTPRIVARGVRTTETNKTTGLARLLEVTAALRPGRLYRIAAPTVQFLSDVGDHDVWVRLEWFDLPWTTWANAARLQQGVAKIGAVSKHGSSPPLEVIFDTTGWSAPKSVGLIVRYDSTSRPTKALCSPSDQFHLLVEDLGPAVPDTGQAWMDSSGSGSSATTKQPFELLIPTAGWATYARGGARIWGAEPYQGAYTPSDNREVAFFFQDVTAELAGADISSIELAAFATHWWWGSGGVGRWHLHGQASPGSTAGLSTYLSDTDGWPRNAWGIYQVPASYFAGFKSGAYRGFGFSSASTDQLYYGQFSGAGANAPYIRIRGVK